MVTGGISYDIFDAIASHYGFSFNVKLDEGWIEINEDGSFGGLIGNVSMVLYSLL